MVFRLPDASQQAAADAVVDRVDVGTTNTEGRLRIYTGTQPTTANDAATGTLLVEIPLANPAFGAANISGEASLLGVGLSAAAAAGGTAGWARVVNRDVATVFDGSVTATGGGGDFIASNTAITAGQTVTVSAGTYTHPDQ